MPKTVTARFESEEEAEAALSAIAAKVPLRDSAVVSKGLAGSLMLDSLHLTPEERAASEQQLSKGGFLLVAQVASEARREDVLRLLDNVQRPEEAKAPLADRKEPQAVRTEERVPAAKEELGAGKPPEEASGEERAPAAEEEFRISRPSQDARREEQAPAAEEEIRIGRPSEEASEEERIPIVEEELRIGKREVVKGRSRVRTFMADIPVQEQVELLYEETHLERRPVNRRLTEEEVAEGGLLQERVIEITEMREEAVVTKEAFVREELVVQKSMHRRVEHIEETVRQTQVETERLTPDDVATTGR